MNFQSTVFDQMIFHKILPVQAFAQLAQGIPDEFADDLCMKCEIMVTEPSHANLGIASALVER